MKRLSCIWLLTLLCAHLLAQQPDLIVAQDGSGDFRTIQAAVNAVPDYRKQRTVILIKAGTYRERVNIPPSKQLLTLRGDSTEATILVYNNSARTPSPLFPGETLGTSGSATLYTAADDLCIEHMTIANDAGPQAGQAVAAHVSGDRIVFRHCRLLGHQDTLYTFAENSRQYYDNCYIEGTTDFIFGWSTAVFRHCTIHSLADSYITAAATPQHQPSGYTFLQCRLTAAEGIHSVYLGRPWRIYAKTAFIQCYMGPHIRPEGWHNWNKPEAEHATFYAEYANNGPGSNTEQRVTWAHQLSDKQAQYYHPQELLAGNDDWNPAQIRMSYRSK